MSKENNFFNVFILLAFTFLLFYILTIGANLIIPFIIALLFSFAIIGLADFYKKIGYKNFKIPSFIAMLFSLGTYIFLFWLIAKMINTNIQDVINLLPIYQERIGGLYIQFLDYFKISHSVDAYSLFEKVDISSIFTSVISSVTSIFSNTGVILFYVMFILLEYRFFGEKLKLILPNSKKNKDTIEIIQRIKYDIKLYFVIKIIVSFITGLLSYFVMKIAGLDFALFWAMIIFLLNFIPNIGSIIAVFFPVVLSLIQYDSLYPFFFISTFLIGIQVLMGNIIEPKFMGNKLNLSPLVIIIALLFWGAIWGIVGMLLSVPLMVIINIILSKFETTKPIAILLSEKGELDVQSQDKVEINKKSLVEIIRKKLSFIIRSK